VDVTARLAPVLEIAVKNALDVDVEGRYPAEAVQALRESGLLGLTVPTEAGGLGGGPHELVATVGALAGVCGSTAMIYLMHVSAVMPVAVAPPPDLPKLLTQLADGSTLGSLAFSEAGSRSHFWAPVSKATRDGDTVRLQARKSWVTLRREGRGLRRVHRLGRCRGWGRPVRGAVRHPRSRGGRAVDGHGPTRQRLLPDDHRRTDPGRAPPGRGRQAWCDEVGFRAAAEVLHAVAPGPSTPSRLPNPIR